jgi:phosphoglycerol transferase MdoB-like AlkP superfamily enzyme
MSFASFSLLAWFFASPDNPSMVNNPFWLNYPFVVLLTFVLVGMECYQSILGEPLRTLIIDSYFFALFVFLFNVFNIPPALAAVALLYQSAETISWYYTRTGITFRSMRSIDLPYSFQEMKPYVFVGSLTGMVIFACTHIPLKPPYSKQIPSSLVPLLLASEVLIGFIFIQDKINVLYPFRHRASSDIKMITRILNTFHERPTVHARKANLRNLVLFQIESLELAYIGKFNPDFPLSMPWLSETTERYTYFTNFVSQPYTTWTAAGMFATQCGVPFIGRDITWIARSKERYTGLEHIPCIPTFLSALGYKLFAYGSGQWSLFRMKQFWRRKGYQMQDSAEHHKVNDDALFEWLADSVLPRLADTSQWPFVLLILNSDTHPGFHVGSECNDYLAKHGYPLVYRSFTCLDQHLKHFMKRFCELGFEKNTEVVIYGDHLTMGNTRRFISGPRNLTVFMPLRLQEGKWRRAQFGRTMSYYDLAPTVMDLLEIDYSPRFPFGENLFGENAGRIPAVAEMQFIYEMIFGTNTNATCLGRLGICHKDPRSI